MKTLISLYKKPVYEVRYGRNKFKLKTLAGCVKRIEKEGITNYKIYKVEKHIADWTQDIDELVKRG